MGKLYKRVLQLATGANSDEQNKEEAEFVVNEENFNLAYNNAGPLARSRLNKKMEKKKMRGGVWEPADKPVPGSSPHAKRLGYTKKDYLPCADIEQYVKRFVLVHMNKSDTIVRSALEVLEEQSSVLEKL